MAPRILLVDDDVAEIAAARRALAAAGFEVALATNATDALAELAGTVPAAVLLAPACGGGDGEDVARRMVEDAALRAVPMVAIGGEEARRYGRFVERPVTADVLVRVVTEAVGLGGTRPPPIRRSNAPSNATSGVPNPAGSPHPRERAPRQVEPGEGSNADTNSNANATSGVPNPAGSAHPREPAPRQVEPGEGSNPNPTSPAASASWFEPDDAPVPAPPAGRRDGSAELRALLAAEAERAAREEAARQRALSRAREREEARPLAAVAPDAPPPATDALAGASLPRALALVARSGATGRLEARGDVARALWVEDGRVVGAASAAADERAEEVALRMGLLTREQHRAIAAAAAPLASRRAGALLLDRGYVKGSELALLARRRAEEVACAMADAGGGLAFTRGDVVPPDERVALERGTLSLAVEVVRRRWRGPRVDAILGGGATLLERAPSAPPLPALDLAPAEARLAELADGLRTVDELVADAALDRLSALQALAALVEVGVLSVKTRAAARPAGPTRVELARVEEKHAQVRRADYFTILGVPRDATAYAVREAAERLLAELAPDRFVGTLPEGVSAKLREIRDVVADARAVLTDEDLRVEYLAGLAR